LHHERKGKIMEEKKAASSTVNQYVTFILDGEEYAIDIMCVQEIIRLSTVTKVPRMPEFVEGVINLRGKVIPVIDLRSKFGLSKSESDKNSRIVVAEVSEKITGLIVDSVSQVISISGDDIEPAPSMGTSVNAEYIFGMGKVGERLIILLDIGKILSESEVGMMES
jgi:purine-binding chemotaxis protein CheW